MRQAAATALGVWLVVAGGCAPRAAAGGAATAPAQAAGKAPGVEVHTAHYDLYLEGIDGREAGELVEALHARLREFFGAEPGGRLAVRVYADEARYRQVIDKLVADKVLAAEQIEQAKKTGGEYVQGNKTTYVFIGGGGPYDTRAGILHECTHQFHFLSRTGNRLPKSDYYTEGLAEHFSMHRWNGRSADLEKTPAIAPRDVPGDALKSLAKHAGSIRALAVDTKEFSGGDEDEYGGAWALVSFLTVAHREQYQKWSAALDAMAEPRAAWEQAFGKMDEAALSRELAAWLAARQEPWLGVAGDWENTDERTIFCTSADGLSVAVLKRDVEVLSATAEAHGEKSSAGVVVGYESPRRYHWIEVTAAGDVRVHAMDGEKWNSDAPLKDVHVRDPRRFHIEVRRGPEGMMRVSIDGVKAVEVHVPVGSKIGLGAQDGTAVFGEVKVGP